MNNSKILVALGFLLVSGQVMASTPRGGQVSVEAAHAAQALIDSGYAKVDSTTGNLILESSVMEILKKEGLARQSEHSSQMAGGCQDSDHHDCF